MKIEKIKKLSLSKDAKDKILKIAITLFPEYGKVTMNRNGNMKFFRRYKLFPQVRVHYLDFCLRSVPRRMSMNRYGNFDLTAVYYGKIAKLINDQALNFIIDYLWEEFLKVRVVDVGFDLNTYVIPMPGGQLMRHHMPPTRILTQSATCDEAEELKIVSSDGSIIRTKDHNGVEISLEGLLGTMRVGVASLFLFAFLNFSHVITSLKVVSIWPQSSVYSFM